MLFSNNQLKFFIFCAVVHTVICSAENKSSKNYADSLNWNQTKLLRGHESSVMSLAINEQGLLISGSASDSINVWDLKTGKILKKLDYSPWIPTAVLVLEITKEGHLVGGLADGVIKVWNIETGKCLHTLDGHTDAVQALAISKEGFLVSGSRDRTIKVWNIETEEVLKTLTGHADTITALAFSKDDRLFSAGHKFDSTIKVWDIKTGYCLDTLPVFHPSFGRRYCTSFEITRNGLLYCGALNWVWEWDIQKIELLRVFNDRHGHKEEITSIKISKEGHLYSTAMDLYIRIWDIKTGKHLKSLQLLYQPPYDYPKHFARAIAFGQEGQLIAAPDTTIQVWEIKKFL